MFTNSKQSKKSISNQSLFSFINNMNKQRLKLVCAQDCMGSLTEF